MERTSSGNGKEFLKQVLERSLNIDWEIRCACVCVCVCVCVCTNMIGKYQMQGHDCYKLLSVSQEAVSTLHALAVCSIGWLSVLSAVLPWHWVPVVLGSRECQPALLTAPAFSRTSSACRNTVSHSLGSLYGQELPWEQPSTNNKQDLVDKDFKVQKACPVFSFCLREGDCSVMEWFKWWELSK